MKISSCHKNYLINKYPNVKFPEHIKVKRSKISAHHPHHTKVQLPNAGQIKLLAKQPACKVNLKKNNKHFLKHQPAAAKKLQASIPLKKVTSAQHSPKAMIQVKKPVQAPVLSKVPPKKITSAQALPKQAPKAMTLIQPKPIQTKVIAKPQAILPKSEFEKLGEEANKLVNDFRRAHHLPDLQLSLEILPVAKTHASQMASRSASFSHDGFKERANEIMKKTGAKSVGENLAMNKGFKDPAKNAVDGWINSPGHRKNLLGDFTKVAIGVNKSANGTYYFSQLLAK